MESIIVARYRGTIYFAFRERSRQMAVPKKEDAHRWVDRFCSLPGVSGEDGGKRDLLAALIRLFVTLASDAGVCTRYPEMKSFPEVLTESLETGDPDEVEAVLLRAYVLLHGKSMGYAPSERREMNRWGGYWCHAGGFAPLRRAAGHIHQGTRLADYGAGNGLQGLLFQFLYPHAKTTQIELSGPMIEEGKRLQRWMGIPAERVEWIHGNVLDIPPDRFDFIYLYRPVRPEGPGKVFYEKFAGALTKVDHPVTIFSIADCLKEFLGENFPVFYDDGQLTCFRSA